MSARIFDDRVCQLGEGPMWHPERGELFWFDIEGKRLLCSGGAEWQFDHYVSACGWVDKDTLLIASEVALFQFDIETGAQETVCDLEADDPTTRSNDGRADPFGGFWIGTMAKDHRLDGGAIYRYHKGELRRLFAPLTITNATCFAPDGSHAYFADTVPAAVFKVALDKDGWPRAAPTLFLDLAAEELNPDGAVIAANGMMLNAQWGASRIALYDTEGKFVGAFHFPATQISCPAFGGEDLSTLFATSAAVDMSPEQLASDPEAGKTFAMDTDIVGQKEHQVIL